MNLDNFNNINVPVPSKTSFVDGVKEFFGSRRKAVVASSSFLIAMVMTGSVFYLAYKTYNQRNVATNTGAANPSCYLELSLATPKPSATPIVCNRNLDIALVIDRSSTMKDIEADGRTKLDWAKESAAGFVQSLINSGSKSVRVSVSSFGSQGNDGTGTLAASYNSTLDAALTNNLPSVLTAINNIKYINSGTCIECGLRIGNSQLTSTTNRKIEILLSDGMANHLWNGGTGGSKTAAIAAANAGRASGIEYRALGYGVVATGDIDEATLISIAGLASNYQYKPNVADWSAAFNTILADICTSTAIPTSTAISATKSPSPKPTASPTVKPTSSVTPKSTSTPVAVTTTNLVAIADSYVNASLPTLNYNNAKLLSDGSPVSISYMKFDLTSLLTKTITNAVLRLTVADVTAGTETVYSTTGAWTETALNYNNRPTLSATSMASFKVGAVGTTVDVDITNFVKANVGKVVTLVINSASTDGFDFNSREAATGKPTIVVK